MQVFQIKWAQAKIKNKLLSTPKSCATESDRWTIFGMCVWGNTRDGALFNTLMNVLFQIGGRVSEGSTVSKHDIKALVRLFNFINFETFIISNLLILHLNLFKSAGPPR